MDFRLLGPVEVRTGDGVLELGPAKQRCVLAALALRPGRPVPTELLVERVWGDDPPSDARGALYSYLTRLRGTGVRIPRTGPGYLLDVPPEHVDLHRFTTVEDLDLALREWRASRWTAFPANGCGGCAPACTAGAPTCSPPGPKPRWPRAEPPRWSSASPWRWTTTRTPSR